MDANKYLIDFFKSKSIVFTDKNKSLLDSFCSNENNLKLSQSILDTHTMILEKFKLSNRIFDIQNTTIILPNATVGKEYSFLFDFKSLNLEDIIEDEFLGLEDIGLRFNKSNDTIEGTPTVSGDLKLKLQFKLINEEADSPKNEKIISLVVNPNPKDLWKSIPSDQGLIFAKPDDISLFDTLGDKSIVVSSKRGRSHANVGSSRDDDFAYKYLDNSGWSIVVVSDGAGGSSLSRQGSILSCNSIVDYFENHIDSVQFNEFEAKILEYTIDRTEELLNEINGLSKQILYKSSIHTHTKLRELAESTFNANPELFNNPKAKHNIDYFHSTLIFALFKKYEFGYIIQTFGVGDCPIAVMNKDMSETALLNWLDVGEHGGGTRFITQPDIFQSMERPIASRFNLKIIDDFSFLFLMTDGVYDAKFEVESNLKKNEKWLDFLADLNGKNAESVIVHFDKENKDISTQLSTWMDFWSIGNHDDRTLAIIF